MAVSPRPHCRPHLSAVVNKLGDEKFSIEFVRLWKRIQPKEIIIRECGSIINVREERDRDRQRKKIQEGEWKKYAKTTSTF